MGLDGCGRENYQAKAAGGRECVELAKAFSLKSVSQCLPGQVIDAGTEVHADQFQSALARAARVKTMGW
jgi:hypothetical protein